MYVSVCAGAARRTGRGSTLAPRAAPQPSGLRLGLWLGFKGAPVCLRDSTLEFPIIKTTKI